MLILYREGIIFTYVPIWLYCIYIYIFVLVYIIYSHIGMKYACYLLFISKYRRQAAVTNITVKIKIQ